MARKRYLSLRGMNTSGANGYILTSTSPDATRGIGKRLGERLFPRAVVALTGDLGSGKTVFAQGLLRGLEVKEKYMISPSFVLIKEYKGRYPVYHLDLFRLKSKKELNSLGLEEYLFGSGVAIVEWADRVVGILPKEYLRVHIELTSSSHKRILSISTYGKKYKELLEKQEL